MARGMVHGEEEETRAEERLGREGEAKSAGPGLQKSMGERLEDRE